MRRLLPAIKRFLNKAVDEYHALNTAGKWPVTCSSNAAALRSGSWFWNCGIEGHVVQECRKPKDQDTINANKKKWQEQWGKSDETSGGGPPIEQQECEESSEGAESSKQEESTPPPETASSDHVLVSKAHARSVLSNLERTSASDDTVEMCAALCTLFSLN